jgi:heme/copper-type cytochrome/quinol oxidase subunit 1
MFTVGLGAGGTYLLHLRHHDHLRANRDQDIQLAGDAVGRQDSLHRRHDVFCRFLFQFLIAGLTGIMLSVAPFDWQLGNSYFVVAHFHYVLVGAILFMIFAAFYYWYPKMTGRMLSEKLGKWHFWLFLIGFHLTFDFMHIPGLLGMPRRIYTYEADRGWAIWNMIVSSGAAFQAVASLLFVYNLVWSYFKGAVAGPIRGTHGRWSGRPPRRRRRITSPSSPPSRAAGRFGT